jgi:integrase/recombinase XerD
MTPPPETPIEWERQIEAFRAHLAVERNLSPHTVASYLRDLRRAVITFLDRSRRSAGAVRTEEIHAHLAALRDDGLAPRSIARALSSLKTFFRFIVAEERLALDPTEDAEGPRAGRALPKSLHRDRMKALLDAVDLGKASGVRDRAILEILYSSGLRVSEAIAIRLADLSIVEGLVKVRGKGRKERIVPVGRIALEWVGRYLAETRPALLGRRLDRGFLFLNVRGGALTRQAVWLMVKAAARRAGLRLSPHTLRHAFATHLVEAEVDLRSVQELLGHADISTTQIYTAVSDERLKSVHKKYHPRG